MSRDTEDKDILTFFQEKNIGAVLPVPQNQKGCLVKSWRQYNSDNLYYKAGSSDKDNTIYDFPDRLDNSNFTLVVDEDIVVVDIDVKKITNKKIYKKELSKHSIFKNTFTVATPSGGYHLYYRVNDLRSMDKLKGRIGVAAIEGTDDFCIDFPYNVVIPPSIINGNGYKIITNVEPKVIESIEDLPLLLRHNNDGISKAIRKIKNRLGLEKNVGTVDAGERNDTMYRIACVFGEFKVDIETALNTFNDCYLDKFDNALSITTKEIETTFQSAYKKVSVELDKEAQYEAQCQMLQQSLKDWYYVYSMKGYYDVNDIDNPYCNENTNKKFSHLIPSRSEPVKVMHKEHIIKELDRLDYLPGKDRIVDQEGKTILNIYNPPDLEENDNDPKWFIEHLKYLFKEDEIEHFLRYIAFLVQNPDKKIRHSILITGGQQIGKSIMVRIFEKLLGKSNVKIPNAEDISGNYNHWMRSARLVVMEETYQGGRREFANKIKVFTTESEIRIREMYKPSYTVKNHANIIAISNDTTPLFLDQDDNRWYILHSEAKRNTDEYYENFMGHIEEDCGGLLKYLKELDLSNFNAAAPPPDTSAKEAIKEESLTGFEFDFREMYNSRQAPFDKEFGTMQEIQECLPQQYKYDKRLKPQKIGAVLKDMGCFSVRIKSNGRNIRYYILDNLESNKLLERNDRLCDKIRKHYSVIDSDENVVPFKSEI